MKPIIIIILLLIALSGFSQPDETSVSIVTDRPSFSASSRTVPHKSLQIEAGFSMDVFNAKNSQDFKTSEQSFPTPMIRWGAFKGVEFRLFNTFLRKKTEDPTVPVEDRNSYGFGNLIVGTKINITKEKGVRPEIAVLSHLIFPTGHPDVRLFDELEFDILFSLSHRLFDKFSLGCNLGWASVADSKNGDGIYSLILEYGISDKFSAFIEGFGFLVDMNSGTFELDGGISYLLKPHMQFDIAGGRGFTTNSYFISFGFSILFAQLY